MRYTPLILAAALLLPGCAGDDTSSKKNTDTTPAVTTVTTTAPPQTVTEPAETEAPAPPLFDAEAVLGAYRSGDVSGLDDEQLAVLEAAEELISETVTEGMDLFEQELAIHDRLALLLQYDKDELNPFYEHGIHSCDAYGGLVEHRVICTGYANTFSLMMSMIGVENLVVSGTNRKGNEHAWNLVNIGGEWYAVDLTWDDLGKDDSGIEMKHRYFNVSDAVMAAKDHKWDMNAYPRTTGGKYSYFALIARSAEHFGDVKELVSSRYRQGFAEAAFIPARKGFADGLLTEDYKNTDDYRQLLRMLVSLGLGLQELYTADTDLGRVIVVQFAVPEKKTEVTT